MPRVALFVTHGMGQQTKFQTMAAVAEGLRRAAAERGDPVPEPLPAAVKLGDVTTQCLGLRIHDDDVHVYEGYWAPMTEGAIGIGDLVAYLRAAGIAGLRMLLKGYSRTLFGEATSFRIAGATAVYLLLALLVLHALIFINSMIVFVAAQKTKLAQVPLLNESIDALTAGAAIICVIAIAYALATTAAGLLKARIDESPVVRTRRARVALQLIPFLLGLAFFSLLFSIILVALAMVGAMAFRWNALTQMAIWQRFGGSLVESIRQLLGGFAIATVAFSAAAAIWSFVCALGLGALVVRTKRTLARWSGTIVAIALCALAAWTLYQLLPFFFAAIIESIRPRRFIFPIRGLGRILPATFDDKAWLWLWPLLLWLSVRIKRVVEQYLGDVAIYVGSHRMDRFDKIRDAIRDKTCSIATAIFAAKDDGGQWMYDKVVFAGHSLGSVIVYDTINRLMLADQLAAPATRLDVVGRTGGLVTFGSPLDKTTYLFALNRSEGHGTEEGLANTIQPLLQSYENRRFRWVNVYSLFDIISGSLTFFDAPTPPAGANTVKNVSDEDALVFVTHHTHYWAGRSVWRELYAMI